MNTVLRMKWFATQTLTLAALSLPLACSAASDVGEQDETAAPAEDQSRARRTPPPVDLNAERFNLLPEGASLKDGYWVSTVGVDAAGKPVLVNARLISEAEMLKHSAEQMAAIQETETASPGRTANGVGQVQEALGRVVNCDTFPAAPTHLGLYTGLNMSGNRICIQGGGNRAWFQLFLWYWGLGTPDQVQVSGNISSYIHRKRFSFDAWTDRTIATKPTWHPGPFFWPTTGSCFAGSAIACPNPNGCVAGSVSVGDTRNSCAPFITWLDI